MAILMFVVLQVCKFLEVSCLSFLPEYGPKLKEDYVSVGHLPKIRKDHKNNCCSCGWFSCCQSNWQKVLSCVFVACLFSAIFVILFELFNLLFLQ
jgi:phospholipase D1/2